MEFFNNDFTVTFSNKDAAAKAKQIASRQFNALHVNGYSDDPSKLFADSLRVENTAVKADALVFDSYDFMGTVAAVIKAIALELKTENFSFEACASDTYSESWVDGKSENGILTITSTYFPSGYSEYLCCPECGEPIVEMLKYDPNVTYVCSECGEELVFSEDAPKITKEVINL